MFFSICLPFPSFFFIPSQSSCFITSLISPRVFLHSSIFFLFLSYPSITFFFVFFTHIFSSFSFSLLYHVSFFSSSFLLSVPSHSHPILSYPSHTPPSWLCPIPSFLLVSSCRLCVPASSHLTSFPHTLSIPSHP